MARFCATKGRLCFFPACNLRNECRNKETAQPVEDTDDDDEDTLMSAVGLGVDVASLFGDSDPVDDAFTGGGGDFGGGGASDDF